MSSSLSWKPVIFESGNPLPDALKFILRGAFGSPLDHEFDESNIDFLLGLEAAGIDGACECIKSIKTHGKIRVYEEW